MPIDQTNSLIQGIYRDFKSFWKEAYVLYEKIVNLTCYRLPGASDSSARFAKYAWKESVPAPQFWNFDEGRQHQMFGDVQITVPVHPYELTVDVRRFDREHDQLGAEDARAQIQQGVNRYAQLPQIFASEQLNGAADKLPQLENAYDGVSLFSTTDGDGADRFGASGGNIVNGSGVSFADFQNDLWTAQQRYLTFLDPAGEILFGEEEVSFMKMHIIAPKELNQTAHSVAEAEYLRIDDSNQVSQTNILKGTFQVHIFNYLTDSSDWYVILEHPHKVWRPFALRQNEIDSVWADMTNSDRSREQNFESLYTSQNTGLSVLCPFVIIKINN